MPSRGSEGATRKMFHSPILKKLCSICRSCIPESEVMSCMKCEESFHIGCVGAPSDNFECAKCTHTAPKMKNLIELTTDQSEAGDASKVLLAAPGKSESTDIVSTKPSGQPQLAENTNVNIQSPGQNTNENVPLLGQIVNTNTIIPNIVTAGEDNKFKISSKRSNRSAKYSAKSVEVQEQLLEERRRLHDDLDLKWRQLQEKRIDEYMAEKERILLPDDRSSRFSNSTCSMIYTKNWLKKMNSGKSQNLLDDDDAINQIPMDSNVLNVASKIEGDSQCLAKHQVAGITTNTSVPANVKHGSIKFEHENFQQPTAASQIAQKPANFPSGASINIPSNSQPFPAIVYDQYDKKAPSKLQFEQPMCSFKTSYDNRKNSHDNKREVGFDMSNFFPNEQAIVYPTQQEFVPLGLSSSQWAARRNVSRDLPKFSGNAEEWQFFITSYEESTHLCGFTHAENLSRLKKCLTGEAADTVRSSLQKPKDVPEAIETLRLLYGAPAIIVNSLLEKIRKEPPPKLDDRKSMLKFAINVKDLCTELENSRMSKYLNDALLLEEFVEKMPFNMKYDWRKFSGSIEGFPSLSDFQPWIMQLTKSLASTPVEIRSDKLKTTKPDVKPSKFVKPQKAKVLLHAQGSEQTAKSNDDTKKSSKCVICDRFCRHPSECVAFMKMSYNERWTAIKKFRLCRTCLLIHGQHCNNRKSCGISGCTYKHHPMLHLVLRNPDEQNSTKNAASTSASTPTDTNKPEAITQQILTHRTSNPAILFRIFPVIIHGPNGVLKIYALCDEGSSLTMIESKIAEHLGMSGNSHPLCLKWTGNTHRIENDSKKLTFNISSSHNPEQKFKMTDVRTIPNLNLPRQTLNYNEIKNKFTYLNGLPIESYENVSPQLLIGMDNYQLICGLNSREGVPGQPIAVKARLGWSVCGPQSTDTNDQSNYSFHACECENTHSLDQMMKDFFAIENMCIERAITNSESSADRRAKEILENVTVRRGNQFESGLLWKYDSFDLPNSLPMAERRLQCLKAKMRNNAELSDNLELKITEHLQKGYIRKLSDEEMAITTPRTWYLPVFPVFNPKKPGKVRLVWDAAAKSNSVSLNDMLLKGPDQLASLPSVLFKFRERKIAISADIQEMFHRVLINPDDQQSQRFLWHHAGDEHPTVYVMQVMTFGSSSSPSTAQYVKNRNAKEFANEFPRAVRSIIENHYVDDMLDSVDSEDEAVQLAKEVKMIHERGGFHIRGWISNSPAVVAALETSKPGEKKEFKLDSETGNEKVLGMTWNTTSDTFNFQFSRLQGFEEVMSEQHRPTKRELLKFVMRIFDPLGLISHFTIYAKIIIQKIWLAKLDWDDPVPDEISAKWYNWLRHLLVIDKIEIPRWYLSTMSFSDNLDVEMHVFVDASRDAYAANVYFRVEGSSVECSLVCAKAKVAPLKLLSIPRLELESAVLGVRLANSTIQSHTIKPTRRYFWSDSKTVLSWIKSDTRKYRPYVAFRVSEINEYTDVNEWRYVPSALNVADEATKWTKNPTFESKSRWYIGPDFLYRPKDEWPENREIESTHEEELSTVHFHTTKNLELVIDPKNFSTWHALRKRFMSVNRFIFNIRAPKKHLPKRTGIFNCEEFQEAEAMIYRLVQADSFPQEISISKQTCPPGDKNEKRISKSSPLIKVNPFLDEEGVMRSRGRIQAARDIPYATKNPVILPRGNHVTNLIILHYHEKYRHHNFETTTNELRQIYYIPKIRVEVKKVSKMCQLCKIRNAEPTPPMMADLPSSRLQTYTRPFSFIGIDYFGPLLVVSGRSHIKRWGVLITCLTIRAIHIELAEGLTTKSCILCLRNFMSRRGVPIEIRSDRGTNFIGANRELQNAMKEIDENKLAQEFVSPNTKWLFNPPASPHMGGSWERLVQSVKRTLNKITVTRVPTEEVLRSMLIEAENIINSRPLTYLPIDSEQGEALTPNHFLLGSSNGLKPLSENRNDVAALRNSWLASQTFLNHFWKRWIVEYSPILTRRDKWTQPVKPIAVGDIAIIVDDQSPRNCWIKGKVIQTTVSKDGQVRSATVQTQHGVYERPAVKLAILDVKPEYRDPSDPNTGGECQERSSNSGT